MTPTDAVIWLRGLDIAEHYDHAFHLSNVLPQLIGVVAATHKHLHYVYTAGFDEFQAERELRDALTALAAACAREAGEPLSVQRRKAIQRKASDGG